MTKTWSGIAYWVTNAPPITGIPESLVASRYGRGKMEGCDRRIPIATMVALGAVILRNLGIKSVENENTGKDHVVANQTNVVHLFGKTIKGGKPMVPRDEIEP